MPYHGHVENGVVVLDEDATIPEGTPVLVDPVVPDNNGETQFTPIPNCPFWGMLADEPELADMIAADAMRDRLAYRLRDIDV